jgi:hypothetical protein
VSLFPVKVWIDSETFRPGTDHASEQDRFVHLYEFLYYVEARTEDEAKRHALVLYMREHAPKHIRAHTDGSVYVEKADPK